MKNRIRFNAGHIESIMEHYQILMINIFNTAR